MPTGGWRFGSRRRDLVAPSSPCRFLHFRCGLSLRLNASARIVVFVAATKRKRTGENNERAFSIFANTFLFGYGIDRVVIDSIDNGLIRVKCYRRKAYAYTVFFTLTDNGSAPCNTATHAGKITV